MGTRGYRAYRYKYRYYRQYTHWDPYPSHGGQTFADMIPRDALEREAWIEIIIKALQEGVDQRRRENIEDQEQTLTVPKSYKEKGISFEDILDTNEWIIPDIMIEWTYVVDLDHRAFTVNGVLHFNLDNMPNKLEDYIDGESILPIPKVHLTTVSLWPNPGFDADTALVEYETHQPQVVALEEWGTPTWKTLSVSQHLSVELVKTIVSDYREALDCPEFAHTWAGIVRICWQIICAAAPSHLFCPSQSRALSDDEDDHQTLEEYKGNCLLNGIVYASSRYADKVPFSISGESIFHVYCWFRSCLIAFCLRMDEEPYFKHEICQMVGQLRSNGRTGGVGIVMSSSQMVVVAVDGSEVRHSPLLKLYNADGEVQDAVLLLVHLLGPALMTHKLPWTSPPLLSYPNPNAGLPEDIIGNIIPFTDEESYHFVLPLVSRFIRQICLERPRVGKYILSSVNPDGTFETFKCGGQVTKMRTKLVRTERKELLRGLFGTFQHHQTGVGDFANITEAAAKLIKEWEPRPIIRRGMMWDMIVGGKDLLRTRIQVIDGRWDMVRDDKS
ncbi:hypothetical protein FRC08_006584 [Ceratobasidium sp. 394]|nr:hypothetical protein FRC08_006584 [Ceratobasidium sp. 394]